MRDERIVRVELGWNHEQNALVPFGTDCVFFAFSEPKGELALTLLQASGVRIILRSTTRNGRRKAYG